MGASGSVWVRGARFRRILQNYTPPAVATRAANQAKGQWRAAVADGKAAMSAAEIPAPGDKVQGQRG